MYSDIFWIVLRVIICCIIFAYFVFMPFQSRFRYTYGKTALLALLLIVITAVITVLFLTSGKYLADYSSFGILLWLACAVLIFHGALKGDFFEILFCVLMILNLYVNIVAISKVIIAFRPVHMPQKMEQTMIVVGVLIAYCPLLWVLMVKLYKQVIEFTIRFNFWKYIWIIPSLSYMIFFVKIINDYWKNPSQTRAADVIFVILWSFTTYALFCVTLIMLIQTYKGIIASQQARLVDTQLKSQAGQYEKLLKSMTETSRLRHDMRHHLLTVHGLVEEGNIEALRRYLDELYPDYGTGETPAVCGNKVVDVILKHYMTVGEAGGVSVHVQGGVADFRMTSDTDLCIIFGNLMENAMDACNAQEVGQKTIEVRMGIQGKQLTLMVKNSHRGQIIQKNGVYISSKHEGEGIGLASVQSVVEKNHGIMKTQYDDSMFSVYIMMRVEAIA